MLAAQRNAPAEVFKRGAHPALSLGGVGKAAERARLRIGGARAPRVGETSLMLFPAPFDPAQGEEYVAPQMMKAGKLRNHVMPLSRLLRLVEQRQGFVETFADSEPVGQTDLRAA